MPGQHGWGQDVPGCAALKGDGGREGRRELS